MANEQQPPDRRLAHADVGYASLGNRATERKNAVWSARRTTRRLLTVAMTGAVVVALGSCSYRTRWESTELRDGQVRSRGTTTDGIGQWAYFTFPLGFLALGLLMVAQLLTRGQVRIAARQGRGISVAVALVAAASLSSASAVAYTYLQPLLAEQAAGASITSTSTMELVYIAWGLPIVTVAGALGAIVCILYCRSAILSQQSNQLEASVSHP